MGEPRPRRDDRTARDVTDRSEWLRSRIEAGRALSEIADEAGISLQTVRTWLLRYRIVLPTIKQKRKELARMYKSAGSISALADELGVAPETARKRLIEAGVELS